MAVRDDEHLVRFLPNEGWFNQGQVKGDAFRPRKDQGKLKTSVTRYDGKNAEEIKKRGDAWVHVPTRKKPIRLFGWADVMAGAVRTIGPIPDLDVEADTGNTRDPNHANIVGWDIEVGQQMIQAEDVARQSKLFLV